MKSCFGYVRVSTQKQGEGVSLEAQKDAINEFADKNHITINRWFEEQQTAAKSGRPLFNQMLKALRAGKASGVVMHKIDRSARNFFDWAALSDLADSGVDVHFATESLDFQSRGGRLSANIQMAIAEDYVRNLKQEIRKGQRGQLERGLYPFKAPLGYLNNGRNQLKTIDPIKGPLVKQAFELYASGQHSLHSLRKEMAVRGLVKEDGSPLSKGCVEKLLSNPFYTGTIYIKKTGETFPGGHEALITTADFEQVAKVRAGKSGKKVTRHNHLLRGLFRCGHCNRSMIPERQKQKYVYYRCQFSGCPRNIVREELLHHELTSVLSSHQIKSEFIPAIEEKAQSWVTKTPKPAASQRLQLVKFDERLKKLEDAAIEGIIDTDRFHERKRQLLAEKAILADQQSNASQFHQNPIIISNFLELLKNVGLYYKIAQPEEKREIIEIATSNRFVTSKHIGVEPANWLEKAHRATSVFYCEQSRTTSRTTNEEIEKLEVLAELARSPEVERLHRLFVQDYEFARCKALQQEQDNPRQS